MSNEKKSINLPALCEDLGLKEKADTFNRLLNTGPKRDWLKEHKGIQYQPIERVKSNLLTVFQDYDWSIKDVRVVANSILVFGTLTVENPITGKVSSKDGVGAWPIQLSKGSKPLQIENIVQDAIQKNAPAAESLALKNAAAKFGKLFGDGTNEVEFSTMYTQEPIRQDASDKIRERAAKNGATV